MLRLFRFDLTYSLFQLVLRVFVQPMEDMGNREDRLEAIVSSFPKSSTLYVLSKTSSANS